MDSDNFLNVTKLRLNGDFETQVAHLLENVRLSRHEVENLRRLFSDLEETLQSVWPECASRTRLLRDVVPGIALRMEVEGLEGEMRGMKRVIYVNSTCSGCIVTPFGSIVTGLGIKTSDADCYIELPNQFKRVGEKYVMTAKYVLRRRPALFQEIFAITAAKVPIVKFLHVPTRCYCDVSFKSPSGVRNSELIAHLLHMDSRAVPLAVLLKYWSKVHKLTGTNLVPNYALTIMIIFYLQQIKILPSVQQLQRDSQIKMVDNWNTGFNMQYHYKNNVHIGLYDLMGGFFNYYSNYKYEEEIVSPFLGCSVSKKLFIKLNDVPDEFQLYKQNVKRHLCKSIQLDKPMCVQDPFDHSRNSTVAVYPRLAESFISHMRYAASRYNDSSPDDFLKCILQTRLDEPAPQPVVRNTIGPTHMNKVRKRKHNNRVNKNIRITLHNLYAQLRRNKKGH